MRYDFMAIEQNEIPLMKVHFLQYALDTYASETNKVVSTWREFTDSELGYRPHPKSSTVADILKHQLLSERRFFGEFLGTPEPAPDQILPTSVSIEDCCQRVAALAKARFPFLAEQDESWWSAVVPFFDVQRERIWILWRHILHTAHHRTQLTCTCGCSTRLCPLSMGRRPTLLGQERIRPHR
jgi:uncharacterized damage-inducible protein DinB